MVANIPFEPLSPLCRTRHLIIYSFLVRARIFQQTPQQPVLLSVLTPMLMRATLILLALASTSVPLSCFLAKPFSSPYSRPS